MQGIAARISSRRGGLRRVEMTDALAEELDSAPVAEHAHILAREGIWYDALGSFSDWITSNPDDTRLREHRAALFTLGSQRESLL